MPAADERPGSSRPVTVAGPAGRWLTAATWLVLLLAVALAAVPLIPAGVRSESDPALFSVVRASEQVGRMATEPRPIGSGGNERARAAIVAEIRRLGIAPQLQTSKAPDYYALNDGRPVPVRNIAARIRGSDSTGAVALVAHYDTVPASPGANDDASGVAAVLETARAILAGPALRNDVILLLTDGEEPAPRFGSSAFVAEHPWAGDIAFVVNLEAIGAGGPSTLIGTSGPDGWAAMRYAASAPQPMAYSYLTATTELIGGSSSDFATFRDAGIAGVELALLHGSAIYHTMADTPHLVDMDALAHQGESALAITRHVGNLDLRAARTAEPTVFLTVARTVIRYPAGWTLVPVLVGGIALGVAAAGRRRAAWRAVVRGLAATGLTVVASSAVAVAAWTMVAGARNDMGLAESWIYLAGLVVVVVALRAGIDRLVGAGTDRTSEALGVVATWWLLAVPASIALPQIGYLLAWPTLAAGLTVAVRRANDRGGWVELGSFALLATTTLVLVGPVIDTFFQMAQPRPGNLDSQMLWIVAIPAMLIALGVELLGALWPGREREPADETGHDAAASGASVAGTA
jgi:Peptidase family M28